MQNQKRENLLNLALSATDEERERSENLDVGYDPEERTWELIVRHSGSLAGLAGSGIQVDELLNGYAVLVVPEHLVDQVSELNQIEYIEKPKRLFFASNMARAASCLSVVQSPSGAGNVTGGVISGLPGGLTGRGVLVAVIDSGIDYLNQDFRNEDAGCSGFVALGGGSPMDATKGAAARVACPKKSCNDMAGVMRVGKTVPPIVAIPTTSGTGSETTIAAVITDSETHHKYALMDLKLMPLYAILDPELTVGLPPRTTATTGMDALTHAIEAYISWTYNTKESLRLAEEAVKLIFDNLEVAYAHGDDLKARENMMIAAFKAGFAFSRAGVGNVHAIAHTLGGLYNTPHGLANAVILPIVLEDYGEAVYPRLARLSEIAGVKTEGTDAEKAQAFIAEIYAMNERMGIPKGFDFIQEADIPQIIDWALAEANPNYPVPVVYNAARCRKVIDTIRAKAAENPSAEA